MSNTSNWIRDQYNDQPVFIQTSLINKLEKTLEGIRAKEFYDKSIDVSSTLIVVLYKSGTVELRSTHTHEMEVF